jgi:hypothetical protein
VDYRNEARKYIKSAKERLATSDDAHLRYAALDLRHAIEALTYSRATAYKNELPPKEYETWQPKKLMAALLEIDPTADKDSSLAVGVEETYGSPAPTMQMLGTETVFNMGLLRKHYDALGSHLHVPTLKQAQGALPSMQKLRQRCADISDYIDKVLASPVWNSTFGNFASFECHLCKAQIRKRMPHAVPEVTAECLECAASYKLKELGGGTIEAVPELTTVHCSNISCRHGVELFRREMTLGMAWTCTECGGKNVLTLGVRHIPIAS